MMIRIHPFFTIALIVNLLSALCPIRAQEPASLRQEADQLFHAEKWAEAAEAYRKVTEKQSTDAIAWFRLGYAYHAAGDYQKAIPAHTRAADFPRLRPVALYNLACAHSLQGDKDKAFTALKQAIDAGFRNKELIKTDPDLESLRKEPRLGELIARIDKVPQIERQFDFWVGEWNVFNPQGKKVGTSKIEKREKGAVIFENWDNGNGGTGISMNFVDPADKKWKQVWVDQGGGVVRYEGEFKDGAMRFTGTSYRKNGAKELAEATFTPLEDGRVRQFIRHSKDKGKTWYVYFDGYYVRKGD